MSVTQLKGAVFLLTVALAQFLAVECRAERQADSPLYREAVATPGDQTPALKKYPLEVPPASEVLPRLRKLTDSRPQVREKRTETRSPRALILRQLAGKGAPPAPQCFRAAPTRAEFLNMARDNPADANQILHRCTIDLRSISQLPQLPVGSRQLPEDTRQRPVGTWGSH
jgi:hypothetical protein